jgi:hypothetical protein
MVVMDSAILLLLFHPTAKPPLDATTGKPVEKCQERIEYLLENLSKAALKVMIPTPVLSEILVKAGADKSRILDEITNSHAFKIQPFDEIAAIEVAMLTDADLQSGKTLTDVETKAKVKFDRQIVGIAKVAGVKTIYTDDGGLAKRAAANGMTAVSIAELPMRPLPPQTEIVFPEAPKVEASSDAGQDMAEQVGERSEGAASELDTPPRPHQNPKSDEETERQ